MESEKKELFVVLDDHNQHGKGCGCGNCDSNGKSYGAGIFSTHAPDDCIERLYACNEEEAVKRAELLARELGVLVSPILD